MIIEGRCFLILEDEAIVAFALEDMIDDAGGRSICAERLDQAFELIETSSFDAAILDVNVHDRQSYPVAEALAAKGIPFIFATGYGDTLHPEAFAAIPTVGKPYVFEEIERALQRAQASV
jgi:DNA-binding NtrC family response regulator